MEVSFPPSSGIQAAQAFESLVRQRRATPRFRDDPVTDDVIATALELAGQAPSGYNFQPWRFLVLRSADQRGRLHKAPFDQPKITEAPLVIVAFGQRDAGKISFRENVSIPFSN